MRAESIRELYEEIEEHSDTRKEVITTEELGADYEPCPNQARKSLKHYPFPRGSMTSYSCRSLHGQLDYLVQAKQGKRSGIRFADL
jgi:hypothetical protein